MKGRQLVLLLDDYHSCAHHLWAKSMNGLHFGPLPYTLKLEIGALHNKYNISNTTETQPSWNLWMLSWMVFGTLSADKYISMSFFLTFRMTADSVCGRLCTKMHVPKTQGSKKDAIEVSIHPVSAVFHITSEAVKSNQYLMGQGKKKNNEKYLRKNPNHKQRKKSEYKIQWLSTRSEDTVEAAAFVDVVLDTRYFSSKAAEGAGWTQQPTNSASAHLHTPQSFLQPKHCGISWFFVLQSPHVMAYFFNHSRKSVGDINWKIEGMTLVPSNLMRFLFWFQMEKDRGSTLVFLTQ